MLTPVSTAETRWCKTVSGAYTVGIGSVVTHSGKVGTRTAQIKETLEMSVPEIERQKMMTVLAALSDYEQDCQANGPVGR